MFHRCKVIRRTHARLRALALACVVLTGLTPAMATSLGGRDKVRELRAAFTYKFTAFVSWPGEADESDPFRLCVSGKADSIPLFDTISNHTVGKRTIKIVMLAPNADPSRCAILYFSGEMRAATRTLLTRLKNAPVLTIGETRNFARDDGIITIVPSGNRLGFEINLTAARAAGLQIRSQLLDLAQHVY